jgi:hypothetical protein
VLSTFGSSTSAKAFDSNQLMINITTNIKKWKHHLMGALGMLDSCAKKPPRNRNSCW